MRTLRIDRTLAKESDVIRILSGLEYHLLAARRRSKGSKSTELWVEVCFLQDKDYANAFAKARRNVPALGAASTAFLVIVWPSVTNQQTYYIAVSIFHYYVIFINFQFILKNTSDYDYPIKLNTNCNFNLELNIYLIAYAK